MYLVKSLKWLWTNNKIFLGMALWNVLSFTPCTPSISSNFFKAIPHFFHLASNAFPDIRLVDRLEKKKIKKNHKKSRNRRPWYPRMKVKVNIHIFGLTKCTIYCKNVPVFLYAVIFQIKRSISSEKWFNSVVTFCFWKCQKFGSVERH